LPVIALLFWVVIFVHSARVQRLAELGPPAKRSELAKLGKTLEQDFRCRGMACVSKEAILLECIVILQKNRPKLFKSLNKLDCLQPLHLFETELEFIAKA
jgi:uncharacterized membrane protein